MLQDIKLGASVAISWAWGTLIILGMQIAQTKGVEAFTLWAVANALTLTVFGQLYKRGILTEKILEYKAVHWVMVVIQCFVLLLQLKIMNEVLLPVVGDSTLSYVITSLFGVFFVLIMYRHGLETSIWTDNWQAVFSAGAMLAMIGACVAEGANVIDLPTSTTNDLTWGLWSACILLSGIITDLQHWQRAKVNKGNAFEWATFIFSFFLLMVFVLSHFEISGWARVLLVGAILGVTTSTIDSVAVAMHRVYNRKVGTAICLSVCVGWGLLIDIGLVGMWSYFGVIRVALACFMLYMGIKYYRQLKFE
jgi:hypothetical protein